MRWAAAVAVGALLVGCSPDESEPGDATDENAEDGQDNGGDEGNEENENPEDDGGEEEGGEEQAGPPDEAVDEVEEGPDSASAEPGSAHGDVGLFTARTGSGIAGVQIFVFDAQATGDGVTFTVNGQSEGVRLQAPEFTQDAFYVVADGQPIESDEEFSYASNPDEPQGQESDEFTLSFPGAPASGLLAFKGPTVEGGELPAVGMCYDTEANVFSTEYDQCA